MRDRAKTSTTIAVSVLLCGLVLTGSRVSTDRTGPATGAEPTSQEPSSGSATDRASSLARSGPRSSSSDTSTSRSTAPAVGVYVVVNHAEPSHFERDLQQVLASGSTWIRMGMPSWVAGRIHNGTFVPNEERVDFYVDAVRKARAEGLKVAFIQANALNRDSWTDVQFLAYNSQYWRYIAMRFGPYVDLWQVFNEHDASDFRNHRRLSTSGELPAGYLTRLRTALMTARTALREHSAAPMTSPPLGYPINEDRYSRWVTFFDAVTPALDVISVHAYPGNSQRSIDLVTTYLHRLKERYGKPVAVTEFGVPSVRSSGTNAEIGTAIARQIEAIAAADPLCAIVYQLRDRGVNSSDSEQMFGLVRHDFTRKPYFQTVAREISSQNFVVSATEIGRHTVRITWTSVTGSSGYEVGRDGRNGAGHGPWKTSDPARARTRLFTGLRPDTPYVFTVQAVPSGLTESVSATTLR